MSTVSKLYKDANSAYEAGRYFEAQLLFRQAARKADTLGDRPAWFRNLVWAAMSASNLGDVPQAQRLFFEARAGEPPDRPDREAMDARKIPLENTIDHRPVLSRVLEQLEELREFARMHPVRPADLEYFAARIEFERGHFARAREGFERAWQQYSGGGYIKETYAKNAVTCCLAVGDGQGARQWITALEGVVSPFDNSRRVMATEYRLSLALLEADSFTELRGQLRALEDAAAAVDDSESEDQCQLARVRVQLLDPDGGDPTERAHPARQSLTRRLASRWYVHLRFERRLLFLDYRLAALRYAVGMAPVDDLFYTKPQEVPARVTAVVAAGDLSERLRKARAGLGWALSYARKLDGWLECHWRQRKVEARRERIEDIARAT